MFGNLVISSGNKKFNEIIDKLKVQKCNSFLQELVDSNLQIVLLDLKLSKININQQSLHKISEKVRHPYVLLIQI